MIEPAQLEVLQQAITHSYGLVAREGTARTLTHAVGEIARARGVSVEQVLANGRNPEILRQLASALTVGESYFFRQREHFELLADYVARRLEQRPEGAALVWSVGCARGEEPYSARVLLDERLGHQADRAQVVGTDLCEESIRVAREGVYAEWSLRGVPEAFKNRFLRPLPGGSWRLADRLRSRVRFECRSIAEAVEALLPASVEAMLFRNVAIYLESAALQGAYEGFSRVLVPGGLLILASADPAPPTSLFERLPHSTESVYVLRGGRRAEPKAVEEPRTLYGRARELGDGGRLGEALALATRLTGVAPDWAEAHVLRGTLLLASSQAAEAVRELSAAVSLAPEGLVSRYWLALAWRSAGRPLEAREEARRVVRSASAVPHHVRLGEVTAAELADAATRLVRELS